VRAGDVILGIASSGVHSNGFSLVRKIVERSGLSYSDPSPFSKDETLGEALTVPTRIYVKPILATQKETGAIKALAHITGGGFVDNIPRVLPAGLSARIDLSAVDMPKVFGWLAEIGGLDQAELVRTFNCGIGMIAVVAPEDADRVAAALSAAGETVVRFGEMVADPEGPRTLFEGALEL